MTGTLLKPDYPTEEDAQAINQQKRRQQWYYNQHAKPLKPIATGEVVRMRLPGQKTWSTGVFTGLVGPRSYGVQVGERCFIHNRRQLIKSPDRSLVTFPEHDDVSRSPGESNEKRVPQPSQQVEDTAHSAPLVEHPNTNDSPDSPTVSGPRRLTRNRKQRCQPGKWLMSEMCFQNE